MNETITLPMNLLVKPNNNSREIVSVTPQSAGWRYVSFSAHRLAPGESLTLSDDANELCAVILSGMASAKAGALEWNQIGGRKSVLKILPLMQSTCPRARNSPLPPQPILNSPWLVPLQKVNFRRDSLNRPPCGAARAEKAPIRATSAISCPRTNPLS